MWPITLLRSSKTRTERRAIRRLQLPDHRRRTRVVLGLEPLEDRLAPATDMVTNLNLSGPGSLSYEAANAQAGDTIVFQQGLKGTITPGGTSLAAVEISKNLNIHGPGADVLTISGGGDVRVFYVDDGVTASISGLTITGGMPSLPPGFSTFGGGIVNGGNLTLTNVRVTGNSLAPVSANGQGGGIANLGTLTLSASTVDHNSIEFSPVNFSSTGVGGGIYNGPQGTLYMTNDTVDDNQIISGKIDEGGGVYNDALPSAGTGKVSMTNVTIANNLVGGATPDGDGIYNVGSLIIFNSIVYNPNGRGPNPDVGGQIFWDGGNLFGSNVQTQIKTSSGQDQFNKNPLLSSLEDNAGPTWTMALLSGSPALGGGLSGGGTWPTTDQRGFPRPSNIIDIGAYQYQSPVTTTNLDVSSTSVSAGQVVSLTGTVTFGAPSSNTTLGTVTFYNGSTALGTVSLTNGSASLNTTLPVGNNSITAEYSGELVNFFVLNPSTSKTVTIAVSPVQTPSPPPSSPSPSPLPSPQPPSPVGALSLFALGFGPGFQLDIFEVDQAGQVFAAPLIDLFGGQGGIIFLNSSVVISGLVLQDQNVLGLLLGANNQSFLMEILSFSDPHVSNAAVNALLAEYYGMPLPPTGGGGGGSGGQGGSSSQSGSASAIAGTYSGRVSASSWNPPDAYNDPAWFNITLTINRDGSGSLSLGGKNTGTFPAGYVQQNGDGTITIGPVPLSSGDTMELTEARIVNGNQLNANLNVNSPDGASVSFDATYQDSGAFRFVLTRQS